MRPRALVLALLLAVAGPEGRAVDTDPVERIAADPDVVAGRMARDRGDWKEAVSRLQRAERRYPEDADLQNSLGHALRQARDFDGAFRHYRKALQIDPRHRGAHEYIGEAYLQVGDLASAESHLAALRGICMLPCEEMRDLEQSIAAYKSGKR